MVTHSVQVVTVFFMPFQSDEILPKPISYFHNVLVQNSWHMAAILTDNTSMINHDLVVKNPGLDEGIRW